MVRAAMSVWEIGNGTWHMADCFDAMRTIPDGSVDMILCDLPYGTTACSWDSILPFEPLWAEYWRIVKPNAPIILFGAEPFSSKLRLSALQYFKYDWIWRKNTPGGFAQAKNMPLKQHEVVSVFTQGACTHLSQSNRRTPYFPQGLLGSGKIAKNSKRHREESAFGNRPSHRESYVQEFTNYPNSILDFNVSRGFHPTQKPVALFEYLIRTYTQPGETVLDNTAGSGTTAIAAEQSDRRWICIERDPEYSMRALDRIQTHLEAKPCV